MGQPVLPTWQKVDARCTAKINGQSYNAVIMQECEYGYFKVRTAVHDQLNHTYIFTDYPKPVNSSNLKRRFTYVVGLDTPDEDEVSQTA